MRGVCTICGKFQNAKGLCNLHYLRARKAQFPELYKAREKLYYLKRKNRKRITDKIRNSRPENKEKAKIRSRKWYKEHPGYYAGAGQTRLYREKTQGTHTREDIKAIIAMYNGLCANCSAPWKHIDHVVPLARGGSNGPENLQPLCKTCNVRKWAKMPLTWLGLWPD